MGYKSYKDKVLKALDEAKKDACETIGAFVVAEAKLRTPVFTGNLKRSETFEVMSDNKGVIVGSTPNAPYDIWVEKGTESQKAQPHWEPAVMENISKIEQLTGYKIRKKMSGD